MTVEQVDAILRDVCWRSTVYAREILTPLQELNTSLPDSEERNAVCSTIWDLDLLSSECNGDTYLHARDFLNPLLDLRNALAEEAHE